jgi:uncharacterized protein YjbK
MRSSLEVESKLELSRFDFEHLLGSGQTQKTTEQLNVYYDSEGLLAASGSTFRVRFATGRMPVVTLKIPIYSHDGCRTSREIEAPITQAIASLRGRVSIPRIIDVQRLLAPDFADALSKLNISTLRRVGYMRNRRHVVEFAGLGTVELDWAKLPDGKDFYEAEIESDDFEERRRLVDFVRQVVPASRPSTISKFERFQRAVTARSSLCFSHGASEAPR